jgi:hypothetical protein
VELNAASPFVDPFAAASCIAKVRVPDPEVTDPFVTEIVLYSGAEPEPVLATTAPAVAEADKPASVVDPDA